MAILSPRLTATPNLPATYNVGMAETFSWIPIEGAGRPLYARANYITNFEDFTISLSAAELNITSIEIKDGNSNRLADVEDAGNGLNALRVLTQDLDPLTDAVSLADKNGNNVSVTSSTSSLNVNITNWVTNLSSTILNPTTSVSVTLLNPSSSVSISNPITAVTVLNPVTEITVNNPITAVAVVNLLSSITIDNPVSAFTILNPVTNVTRDNPVTEISILNPVTAVTIENPISAITVVNLLTSVTIDNPVTEISILNPVTAVKVDGEVTIVNTVSSLIVNQLTSLDVNVTNPVTAVTILNPITSFDVCGEFSITNTVSSLILNPVTSTNVFGSVSLQDLDNHPVTVVSSTSSLNVNVTNSLPITFAAGSTNTDAFGRLRTSNPLTLFDSSHRYKDNNLWATLTAVDGTASFNQNQGLVDLTVSSLSGSSVIRETTKVFSYQPGKGMLVMSTFITAPSAINLRQRVGYFGQDNGIYFQVDDNTISFVERSLVNGSPSSETIVPLSAWNGDKLDGTGPSGLTLDITKAQILWTDIEWLGVGTVRIGFIINGQFIVCHSFHHANLIPSTYITTASLPLRYEITNKGATNGSHTLKQVCSTVISEGGYELRGAQQAASIPITAPRTFAAAGTYYPIISIRLKTIPDRLDAIAIPTALSLLGAGNGINYNWQLRFNGTTNEGTWTSTGDSSSVEYNITGTSFTGGSVLASGFLNSSNQSSSILNVLKEALFKFQLERNGLTKTPYELTLVCAVDIANTAGVLASLDWEEISR
jgi:hypothetical protein